MGKDLVSHDDNLQYLERLRSIRINRLSRRQLLLGAASTVAGAALVACGGSSSTSTTAPGGTQSTSAGSTSAAGGTTPTTAGGAASPTSGAATPAGSGGTAGSGTLTLGISADFTSLDPALSTLNNDVQYSFNLFDNLIARHPDGKLYPMLATEWKNIDDNTWEFKLRDDVKFHNGDPFTAQDVKFTIERDNDPAAKTRVASIFVSVDHIETPDDYTVRFITKAPDPLLDARLAFYGGQIMPQKYFTQVGADAFNLKPVGTGPVQFVEWKRDDHLTLAANKEYWGGPIAYETVIFKPIPELASRLASLLAGESDIVANLTPDAAEDATKSDKVHLAKTPYTGETVLIVNTNVKPLDNPMIRQALSLAIDRDSIIKDLWRGQASPVNGPIPKTDTIGYDPSLPPYKYDLDQAKQLLQQAGYNDEPIYIETTEGVTANDKPMADAIIAMWQAIGINAVEEVITLAVRAQKTADKSYKGMAWSEPTSSVGEADGMMWRHMGPGGQYRYWINADFDKLGAEAHTTMDATKRADLYKQMVKLFNDNMPWLPILQAELLYGVQNGIDWQPNGNFELDLRAYNLKKTT